MSTLIGVALDEGHLRDVDQTLGQLLPAYAGTMSPTMKSVTLRQILTMTAGLPEDPRDLPGFVTANNWVATVLHEGTQQRPGQSFGYSSAGSHLLSAILTRATGRSTLDYAREKLFSPLGVNTVPAAEPVGPPRERGRVRPRALRLTDRPAGQPRRLQLPQAHRAGHEKLGQLWLNDGRWKGRQLVPASWVVESTQPHVETNATPEQYGYQLWVTTADDHPAYAAIGSGGQLIEVVPDLDLVVVVASADEPGAATSEVYLDLVADYIVPAVGR